MGLVTDKAVWQAETFGHEPIDLTIGELLDRQAEELGDLEALVYRYPEIGIDLRLTFRQYRDTANRVAKGFLALGIQKGEHVAIWATNVPQWILLQMGLAKIGAVLVTVNTAYRQSELEYVLRQGDITTLFLVEKVRDNSYLDSLYSVVPELKEISDPVNQTVNSSALPHFKRAILIGNEPKAGVLLYEQMLKLGESISDETLAARQNSLTSQDVCMIQYTSGTTGFPKGAQMNHYSILNNARFSALRNGSNTGDRLVLPMPLFHVGGCVLGVLSGLAMGVTIIPLIAFDPNKQLELVSQERGNTTSGVPTMLIAMLNSPRFLAGEFDLSSLRLVVSGGSPVPVPLMEQVKEKFGADVAIIFGMTEAAGGITYTLPGDTFELKSATVGLPLPHCDVKIVSPATGELVNLGEAGELWVRGYFTMQGYYNMPEKTAEALTDDGWLRTGDLATMNAQGYINIVGRVKDMIIRGGENIYPAELEAFLMRHPKIAEAQVIGLPDKFMGEEILAVLRLKSGETAGEEEMREYCRGKISHQKIPRYVRFVEAFPTNATGKVKKFELKNQFVAELGLN
jgi:fatty-acyl-CoA synthase